MKTVIIDYGAGNVQSLAFALRRIGVESKLTANAEEIRSADKVLFPGVGEAAFAMNALKNSGLDVLIPKLKQDTFGICLGMQLLCKSTEESMVQGLGIFDVNVRKFKDVAKIPHMGWNTISQLKSPLFENVKEEDVYFVHSFKADICENTIAECEYGGRFTAALHKDNFYACQFHPEKSGVVGEQILKNFMKL